MSVVLYDTPSALYFREKETHHWKYFWDHEQFTFSTKFSIQMWHFFLFQWPINQKLYLICRLLVSFALIGWFFADIIYESETFYQDRTWTYAVYATNWSFLLLVITSVYQTACSLVYTVKSSDNLGTNVLISLLKVKRLKIHFELASLKQKLQF